MARVRIEIWDNGDNIQQAEAEHIDPREAFDRAVAMARAALPPEKPKEPEGVPRLNAGSYTFEMKNVQLTDATQQVLFLDAEGRKQAQTFDVKVVSDEPLRQPCGQRCQDPGGACSDTCAQPEGHEGSHRTSDWACAWDGSEPGKPDPAKCGAVCGFKTCWIDCQRPKDHGGEHRCNRPKDHKRCLNEIGAPSRTRNCHKPLDHEGDCAGEEED